MSTAEGTTHDTLAFQERLKSAIALEHPYAGRGERRSRESEGTSTPAAVLMLFAKNAGQPADQPDDQTDDRPEKMSLLFTKRTETVENHKGQIAFPGGVVEAGEDFTQAALRETEEEVGIPRAAVQVIGVLPNLVTTTGFFVTPVVGVLKISLSEIEMKMNVAETDSAFWFTIRELQARGVYRREQLYVGPVNYPIHVYQLQKRRIWGVTGAMTKNLLDRLASLS